MASLSEARRGLAEEDDEGLHEPEDDDSNYSIVDLSVDSFLCDALVCSMVRRQGVGRGRDDQGRLRCPKSGAPASEDAMTRLFTRACLSAQTGHLGPRLPIRRRSLRHKAHVLRNFA